MSETVRGEMIERLEHRHAELIEELDALNHRLEEALSTFHSTPEQQTSEAEVVKINGVG